MIYIEKESLAFICQEKYISGKPEKGFKLPQRFFNTQSVSCDHLDHHLLHIVGWQ